VRHPRLVEPVRRLLGGDVYLHQYPVNPKAAYHGEAWAWHQDYAAWQMENHMPRPQVINVGVFLDEVTEFNGPVMFILGSHTHGILTSTFDEASASYALHALSEETVASLAQTGRLVCPKGPAGSVSLQPCARLEQEPLAGSSGHLHHLLQSRCTRPACRGLSTCGMAGWTGRWTRTVPTSISSR